MTAGSHTKGGYVTQTLRRSRPNQANAGVDSTAMVTILEVTAQEYSALCRLRSAREVLSLRSRR